jgi:hypothetical protein
MDDINIKVSVTIKLSEDTRDFLTSLLSGKQTPVPVESARPVRKKPVATPEVTVEAPAQEATVAPGPVPETPEVAQPAAATSEKTPTLEDTRAAAAKIIGSHRVEIVERLQELGAKNISSLAPEKRKEFIQFCNMIKGIDDAEEEAEG